MSARDAGSTLSGNVRTAVRAVNASTTAHSDRADDEFPPLLPSVLISPGSSFDRLAVSA